MLKCVFSFEENRNRFQQKISANEFFEFLFETPAMSIIVNTHGEQRINLIRKELYVNFKDTIIDLSFRLNSNIVGSIYCCINDEFQWR